MLEVVSTLEVPSTISNTGVSFVLINDQTQCKMPVQSIKQGTEVTNPGGRDNDHLLEKQIL